MNNKQIKAITKEANKRVGEKYRLLGNDSIKEWQVKLICEVIWDEFNKVLDKRCRE